MRNKNHVITSHNVEQEGQKSVQSDVVIPNELGQSETCQGLRHWRLLFNLGNNFSKPVRNDMERHPEGDNPKDLQTLGSRFFAFAQNDVTSSLPTGGALVEPAKNEPSETACRMAERLGRGGKFLQSDTTTCAPPCGGTEIFDFEGGGVKMC